MDTTDTNLIINNFESINKRMEKQEETLDDIKSAVLEMPEKMRIRTQKQIEEIVPPMINKGLKGHTDECIMSSVAEEITRDDIKRKLARKSISPKSFVSRIPKAFWYVLTGLLVGIAGKCGIDFTGLLR